MCIRDSVNVAQGYGQNLPNVTRTGRPAMAPINNLDMINVQAPVGTEPLSTTSLLSPDPIAQDVSGIKAPGMMVASPTGDGWGPWQTDTPQDGSALAAMF